MDTDKPVSWTARRIPRTWVALGIIVIAVPVALFLVSMKGCACATMVNDSAMATRTGPDTIHIVMHPDVTTRHDTLPGLKILVNDRDVSNQSLIAASHTDLVISPSEGLAFAEGSSVTLQGNAVAGNRSVPVHVQIVATYPTGEMIAIGEQLF